MNDCCCKLALPTRPATQRIQLASQYLPFVRQVPDTESWIKYYAGQ